MIGASFDSTKTPLQDLLVGGDSFWEYYAARAEDLLKRIEAATGKTITRDPSLFRADAKSESYDEGPIEWEAEEPLEDSVS